MFSNPIQRFQKASDAIVFAPNQEQTDKPRQKEWLEEQLETIVAHRWNDMPWTEIDNRFTFKRQHFNFEMRTITPEMRTHTERISPREFARSILAFFVNNDITLEQISVKGADKRVMVENFLDEHFKLHHYRGRYDDKQFLGHDLWEACKKELKKR